MSRTTTFWDIGVDETFSIGGVTIVLKHKSGRRARLEVQAEAGVTIKLSPAFGLDKEKNDNVQAKRA